MRWKVFLAACIMLLLVPASLAVAQAVITPEPTLTCDVPGTTEIWNSMTDLSRNPWETYTLLFYKDGQSEVTSVVRVPADGTLYIQIAGMAGHPNEGCIFGRGFPDERGVGNCDQLPLQRFESYTATLGSHTSTFGDPGDDQWNTLNFELAGFFAQGEYVIVFRHVGLTTPEQPTPESVGVKAILCFMPTAPTPVPTSTLVPTLEPTTQEPSPTPTDPVVTPTATDIAPSATPTTTEVLPTATQTLVVPPTQLPTNVPTNVPTEPPSPPYYWCVARIDEQYNGHFGNVYVFSDGAINPVVLDRRIEKGEILIAGEAAQLENRRFGVVFDRLLTDLSNTDESQFDMIFTSGSGSNTNCNVERPPQGTPTPEPQVPISCPVTNVPNGTVLVISLVDVNGQVQLLAQRVTVQDTLAQFQILLRLLTMPQILGLEREDGSGAMRFSLGLQGSTITCTPQTPPAAPTPTPSSEGCADPCRTYTNVIIEQLGDFTTVQTSNNGTEQLIVSRTNLGQSELWHYFEGPGIYVYLDRDTQRNLWSEGYTGVVNYENCSFAIFSWQFSVDEQGNVYFRRLPQQWRETFDAAIAGLGVVFDPHLVDTVFAPGEVRNEAILIGRTDNPEAFRLLLAEGLLE